MKVKLIIFLRKIFVLDRQVVAVSPCVVDIPYIIYPDTFVEKQKWETSTDWWREFG
jgi:hypothetical protein